MFTEAPVRPIVITCESSAADRREALAEGGRRFGVRCRRLSSCSVAVDALVERGLPQILCEGGPHLLGALTAADLVDELCLTVCAVAGRPGRATDHRGVASTHAHRLDPIHVLTGDDGFLFLRYRAAESPVPVIAAAVCPHPPLLVPEVAIGAASSSTTSAPPASPRSNPLATADDLGDRRLRVQSPEPGTTPPRRAASAPYGAPGVTRRLRDRYAAPALVASGRRLAGRADQDGRPAARLGRRRRDRDAGRLSRPRSRDCPQATIGSRCW